MPVPLDWKRRYAWNNRLAAAHCIRAFHIDAVAANDRVLFKQNGLEAAFSSAGCSNRAACACAHDDEVSIDHLVGSEDRLHAEAGAKERAGEHLEFHKV